MQNSATLDIIYYFNQYTTSQSKMQGLVFIRGQLSEMLVVQVAALLLLNNQVANGVLPNLSQPNWKAPQYVTNTGVLLESTIVHCLFLSESLTRQSSPLNMRSQTAKETLIKQQHLTQAKPLHMRVQLLELFVREVKLLPSVEIENTLGNLC
jgi:hypothetical protein